MYSLHERNVLGLRKARPIHASSPSVMVMLSAWPYRARPARSSPAARTLLCELQKRPRRNCNHAVSACCHVISLPRATTDAARSPARTAPLGTDSMHITACSELASPAARSGVWAACCAPFLHLPAHRPPHAPIYILVWLTRLQDEGPCALRDIGAVSAGYVGAWPSCSPPLTGSSMQPSLPTTMTLNSTRQTSPRSPRRLFPTPTPRLTPTPSNARSLYVLMFKLR